MQDCVSKQFKEIENLSRLVNDFPVLMHEH